MGSCHTKNKISSKQIQSGLELPLGIQEDGSLFLRTSDNTYWKYQDGLYELTKDIHTKKEIKEYVSTSPVVKTINIHLYDNFIREVVNNDIVIKTYKIEDDQYVNYIQKTFKKEYKKMDTCVL